MNITFEHLSMADQCYGKIVGIHGLGPGKLTFGFAQDDVQNKTLTTLA